MTLKREVVLGKIKRKLLKALLGSAEYGKAEDKMRQIAEKTYWSDEYPWEDDLMEYYQNEDSDKPLIVPKIDAGRIILNFNRDEPGVALIERLIYVYNGKVLPNDIEIIVAILEHALQIEVNDETMKTIEESYKAVRLFLELRPNNEIEEMLMDLGIGHPYDGTHIYAASLAANLLHNSKVERAKEYIRILGERLGNPGKKTTLCTGRKIKKANNI